MYSCFFAFFFSFIKTISICVNSKSIQFNFLKLNEEEEENTTISSLFHSASSFYIKFIKLLKKRERKKEEETHSSVDFEEKKYNLNLKIV